MTAAESHAPMSSNVRTALILASIAAVFFLGVIVKRAVLG